jgi:hypothetical protein
MKIIKRIFFRYFDFFVALFSALLINLVPLYSFIRYGVPLYSENGPEAGWVALVSFCGSEYLFYEQKWGDSSSFTVPDLSFKISYPIILLRSSEDCFSFS